MHPPWGEAWKEHYLRWPLKICIYIYICAYIVPAGSVWTKTRKSSGIFWPEVLPAAGHTCALWWARGGIPSPAAQVLPSGNTKPFLLPRNSFILLLILSAFYKYEKMERYIKKKINGPPQFFFLKSQNNILIYLVHFDIHFSRRSMSVERGNFIYSINRQVFSCIC